MEPEFQTLPSNKPLMHMELYTRLWEINKVVGMTRQNFLPFIPPSSKAQLCSGLNNPIAEILLLCNAGFFNQEQAWKLMANMPMQEHLLLSWTSVWAPVCLLPPSDSPSAQMMVHEPGAEGWIQLCQGCCAHDSVREHLWVPSGQLFQGCREPQIHGCGAATTWMREKHVDEVLSFSSESHGKSTPQIYRSDRGNLSCSSQGLPCLRGSGKATAVNYFTAAW